MSDFRSYRLDDILQMEKFYRRNLVNCLSGFKSVNLLGSISNAGRLNLSIFSQVIHVGATPPLMGVLFRPHSVPRHSLENILDTGSFTLNHINSRIYRQAHQTSARYEEDEFQATGLTPFFSPALKAPYVKESHVRIGLSFEERHTLVNDTVLIVGKVQELQIPTNSLAEDGFIDLEKTDTITCSGLDKYHTTNSLERLSYAKPGVSLKRIT